MSADEAIGSAQPVLAETPEEIAYELRAAEGSLWTGSRLLVGVVAFVFASLAFAYFYLRSSNNQDLWRPHSVTAPTDIGAAIVALTVVVGALNLFGSRRLRAGGRLDWLVAGWTTVLGGLLVVGLQIWELTQLPFFPGSSGYASCFVAWAVLNVGMILGAVYWIETLLARSIRLQRALTEEGATTSALPAGRLLQANVEGCAIFWLFTAFVGGFFWLLFYVI